MSNKKTEDILLSIHPKACELENKETLIMRVFWFFCGLWGTLCFFAACFACSVVSDRAKYDGYYVSDYRCYEFNIFGINAFVDPAENFFASPFMIFLYVIVVGLLIGIIAYIITIGLIANIEAKRYTLNTTYKTRLLVEYIAKENIKTTNL